MQLRFIDWLNLTVAVGLAIPLVIGAVLGFRSDKPRGRGIGAASVAMLGGLLVAWAADETIRAQRTEARAGWNLRPVVVLADDLEPGTVLTFDLVSQRPIPEQFVTDSYVTPDQANEVIGKKVHGKLRAGDPLTWAATGRGLAPDACSLNVR